MTLIKMAFPPEPSNFVAVTDTHVDTDQTYGTALAIAERECQPSKRHLWRKFAHAVSVEGFRLSTRERSKCVKAMAKAWGNRSGHEAAWTRVKKLAKFRKRF